VAPLLLLLLLLLLGVLLLLLLLGMLLLVVLGVLLLLVVVVAVVREAPRLSSRSMAWREYPQAAGLHCGLHEAQQRLRRGAAPVADGRARKKPPPAALQRPQRVLHSSPGLSSPSRAAWRVRAGEIGGPLHRSPQLEHELRGRECCLLNVLRWMAGRLSFANDGDRVHLCPLAVPDWLSCTRAEWLQDEACHPARSEWRAGEAFAQ